MLKNDSFAGCEGEPVSNREILGVADQIQKPVWKDAGVYRLGPFYDEGCKKSTQMH